MNPGDEAPLGRILLAGATQREPKTTRGARVAWRLDTNLSLAAQNRFHDKYLLAAEDEDERHAWRVALSAHIAHASEHAARPSRQDIRRRALSDRWLHGGYTAVTWWLHGGYMAVTRSGYMAVT